MKILPLEKDSPHFEFEVDLDNDVFGFEFLWNHRDGYWYMTIKDATGVDIISSLRMVVGWPFLSFYRGSKTPKGQLVFIDTAGESEAGLGDLVTRHELIYVEESEL